MNQVLQIEDVSFGYGTDPVLRNFSLEMREGEQRLLVGPSGSGKSTLVNLICGFLKPRSGTIRISGEPISHGSEAARDAVRKRHVAVVFQTLRLVSALDVKGNLTLASRLAGKPAAKREVTTLLEELGLADKAAARPRELSQGEAQRAAVARALIAKPDLLIADEPTSALDQHNAWKVGRMLQQLARLHGTSLLIATHDTRLNEFFENVVELEDAKREVHK